MRLAILTDIHGNISALEAVLVDLQRQGVDQILFGGDLARNGPRPAECLARIQSLGVPGVVGNTDVMAIEDDGEIDLWTRNEIGQSGVDYLAQLPLHHRLTPEGGSDPANTLLLVHASPRDCFDLLILEPHPLPTSTLPGPSSLEEGREMLAGAVADLILFGHIHYASAGKIDDIRLASIGSVGAPYDGDHRAAYGIATWDGQRWQVEHHRVVYDHMAVAKDVEQRKMPLPRRFARQLREARWISPKEA